MTRPKEFAEFMQASNKGRNPMVILNKTWALIIYRGKRRGGIKVKA